MTVGYQSARCIEQLGPAFYDAVAPADFPAHILRYRNDRAAQTVGLDGLSDAQWIQHFGAFAPLPDNLPQPLALRYHGHQFRTYNPDIGDGRGFLFAQLRERDSGRLLDLGTKGSGTTPYSRSGDGRLTLKGGVREVLATEMLTALSVNTSKTFSLIETGENLQRNDEPSPTRSAVLVRLSHSHIRIGMFQRLAYFQAADEMTALIDYCHAHLLGGGSGAAALLDAALGNVCQLAASYMAAGFVHGVLNTDNINITGESFDYGPYRFAPQWDMGFTAAYFDHGGLYAFGRQAEAMHWNIYQLAKALLLVAPQNDLLPVLESFPNRFEAAMVEQICARLGVQPAADRAENIAVLAALETALTATRAPLDAFYFDWWGGSARPVPAESDTYGAAFDPLRAALGGFKPVARAAQTLAHSYFQQGQPCSLLIDEIEAIWADIAEHDDWQGFEAKIAAIRQMGAALAATS